MAGCCQFKFRCQLFREQGRFEGAILERFPESFDSSLTVEIVFDKYLNFNAKPSNVNPLRRIFNPSFENFEKNSNCDHRDCVRENQGSVEIEPLMHNLIPRW